MPKHGLFATLLHYPANTFLLKNLPRWREDTIRPYMAYATELPPQIFRSVRRGCAARTEIKNIPFDRPKAGKHDLCLPACMDSGIPLTAG